MIIGVDIGGTFIKSGIVSDNKVIRKISIKTGRTKKEIIQNIIYSIEKLFDSNVKSVGIGCPGPADYEKGIIGDTPNLPLNGVNLKKIIQKRFKRKVTMTNDANCFVLGEALRLKKKNVVGLTLGTGVGGGIVIGGKLYKGRGNAGELGHCTINFNGPGEKFNQGGLESYVSAKAIKRDYGKEPIDLKSQKAWNEIGKLIGIGVANLINAFDPDIVVLGGGISRAFNKFKSAMYKEIKKRAITPAKVIEGHEDSAVLGAAAIAQ